MTATPSQSKLRPFWLNARTKLIANRKPLIVYGVLQLLGLPLIVLSAVLAISASLHYVPYNFDGIAVDEPYWVRYGGMYAGLGLIFFCVSLLLGFLFAAGSFDYLFRKAKVDMTYALPINTRQRFFSDFLTGAAMYLLPFLVACGLCYAIFETGCILQDGLREALGEMPFSLELAAFKCIIIVALGMLFLYACTVFAMTCCGTQAESLIATICVLFLVPITVVVFGLVYLQGGMYGIDIEATLLKLLEYTGPAGAGSVFFSFLENETQYPIGSWAAAYLAEILVLVGVTYLLYRHRKAEDTSKPYVYRFMYYFTMGALMTCLYAIAVSDAATLIPVLIFSAVVYLIAEIITNRGFKKFYKSLIRFAVTMAVIAGFTALLDATDYFGVVQRLPEASNISSITFSCNENYNSIYWNSGMEVQPKVELTEPEQIEAVYGLHKRLLNAYDARDNDHYKSRPTEIRITYHLKLGAQFTRRYTITAEQWADLVEPVMRSNAWMQATLDQQLDKSGPELRVENSNRTSTTYFAPDSYQQFIREFKIAYMQDWMNMSDQEFLEPKEIYLYASGIPVRSSFTNTMEMLKAYKCTPPTPDSDLESADFSGILYYLGTEHDRVYINFPITDAETSEEIPSAGFLLPYASNYGSTTGDYVLRYNGEYYFLSPDCPFLMDQLIGEPPENPDTPKIDTGAMLQYDNL